MRRLFFLFFLIYPFVVGHAYGAEEKFSISAETFGQLRNITKVQLSPNGKRVASLRNFKGQMALVTESLDPAEKGQIYVSGSGGGEFRWFRWLNNDRLAVSIGFAAKRYGNNSTETRFVAIDWDKKNPINLVKKQKVRNWGSISSYMWVSQFQDNVISYLSDDSDHILLALDGEKINYPDVYRVNIHTGDRKRVLKSKENVIAWKADEKGAIRLGISHYKAKTRIIYRETGKGSWKTIARYDVIDDDIPFSFYGFSSDPKVIYVTKLDEQGEQAYYRYDMDKGEFIEKITNKDGANVTGIDIDKAGNIEDYTYLDDNEETVHKSKLWRSLSRMLDKNFPDHEAYITSYSKDKKQFIIYVYSATNPGDYYFLDLNSGRLDWFSEVYPGLDDDKLSPMKSVTYQARDGLEIQAYLSLPMGISEDNAKNLPTVIMPHGGPFAHDSYGYDYWVQFLTTRGYAVLQMNYRGSTGKGQEFEEMGHNEWGGKMLDDINDGTRWMIAEGYTDPKRICIVGGSYGGYAALQNLVKEPDFYKCSVSLAPVTDMLTFFRNARKYLGLKDRYLPYIRNEEGSLSDISPYRHVDKINVPVLLFHGTDDRSVDYKHSKMFAKAMKKKKKNIRFITLEDGDHHLSRQKHRIKFFQEMEKFLKKNL